LLLSLFAAMIAETGPNITDETRWLILKMARLEADIAGAFRLLRAHDIEPILIKGRAAAMWYPSDRLRNFDDVDLAIRADDHEKARQVMATEEGSKFNVDLHREFRHLDIRPWEEAFADCSFLEIQGERIRVPCPEDNLRIIAVHWLNDGGNRKERLWDIYYAVSNRPSGFSWEKCLGGLQKHRREWILTAIALAHKYLGLPIDDLPFRREVESIPQWIVREVEREWRLGVPLLPLHSCLGEPRALLTQIRKRLPPNAIGATIEMEGSFLGPRRYYYQLARMFMRVLPSVKGFYGIFRGRS
jgi:hypothetical protein